MQSDRFFAQIGRPTHWPSLLASLKVQIILLVSIVLISLACVSIFLNTSAELEKDRERTVQNAKELTRLLSLMAKTHIQNFTFVDLNSLLEQVNSNPNIQNVVVRNWEFNVLSTGGSEPSATLTNQDIEILQKTREHNAMQVENRENIIAISMPINHGNTIVGAVLVTMKPSAIQTVLAPILLREILATLPLFILALLFVLIVSRRFLSPLSSITEAAEKVAAGDLHVTFTKPRYGEIANLGRAFEVMMEKIKDSLERIQELAFIDSVTNLPNRTYFRATLKTTLAKQAECAKKGAVFFIDLDHFKRVNDTMGHDVGDALLKNVAERLEHAIILSRPSIAKKQCKITNYQNNIFKNQKNQKQALNGDFTLARIGGDEFTLLLPSIETDDEVAHVASAMLAQLAIPIRIKQHELVVQASIGIALFPQDGFDVRTILRAADLAMYHSKEGGRNAYTCFTADLDTKAQKRLRMEGELRNAIENNELSVHFQPQVNMRTGLPTGAEALLRWDHPIDGTIGPANFISIAEDCGLISLLGSYVLRMSVREAKKWTFNKRNIPISVNVSSIEFETTDYVNNVLTILEEEAFSPALLKLEITETTAMADPINALKCVKALKAKGVGFAIDDFGTGYSNLAQLRRVPFDIFKIDRSFITTITEHRDSKRIVETIIAMAKSLNYSTIAEGVETEQQAEFLVKSGCAIAQGYLYGKPMPSQEFVTWLKNKERETKVSHSLTQKKQAN